MLKLPAFSFPALRSEGSMWWLVGHASHSHSFTLNCFWVWSSIPITGWAAAQFSRCWHAVWLTLKRCTALCRAKFGKREVQYI